MARMMRGAVVVVMIVFSIAAAMGFWLGRADGCYVWPDGGPLQDAVNENACVTIPPGEYDGPVKVPPGHTLRGAGLDKTILNADLPLEFGGQGTVVVAAGDCCGTQPEPTRIIEDMHIRASKNVGSALGWSNFSARRVRLSGGVCHGGFIAGPNAEILDSIIDSNSHPRWSPTLGRMIDCRDNGGQIQGAGIYLPAWAIGPTRIERTYFANNNGSDIDCYGSPKGVFRQNTTRSTLGITGLQFYGCHGWLLEANDVEVARPHGGWTGWWCYPGYPGPHSPAAVFACLSSDMTLRNNILRGTTYALTAYGGARLRTSGNVYHGIVATGAYTGIRNAKVLSVSAPSMVVRGQTFVVTVMLDNTGLSPWLPGYNDLRDPANANTIWTNWKHPLPHFVDPKSWGGGPVTVKATLIAPSVRGIYSMRLRMNEIRVQWYGDTVVRQIWVL